MTIPSSNEYEDLSTPNDNNIGSMLVQMNPHWKEQLADKSGLLKRLADVGHEMEGEMHELVPKATGTLDNSIFSRVVQGRNEKGQFTDATIQIGADAEYALPVEFGHHVAGSEEMVPAQPFIRPVAMKKRKLK